MKRKFILGLSLGILLCGTTFAQRAGTVNSGAGRVFQISDLTGDRLGRIVASTEFQVSLTFPVAIQNVGVNTTKQSALIPTIDESDGRVMYLDVVRPGGYATLNVRLVNAGEPLVLKLTVELSSKTSGVLSYSVRDDQGITAVKPAATPLVRIPATKPTPTAVPTGEVQPATIPAPVERRAVPAQAVIRPELPQKDRRPMSPLPVLDLTTSGSVQYRGNTLTAELTRDASASTDALDTYTYKIRLAAVNSGTNFVLLPRGYIRSGNKFTAITTFEPGQPTRLDAGGITGRVTIAHQLSDQTKTFLFSFSPVDANTHQVGSLYLGVGLK